LRRPRSFFRGPPQLNLHVPAGTERLADVQASAEALVSDPDFAPISCSFSLTHIARYRPLLQSNQTVLVVASFSDSDNVLLSVIRELPSLVSFLGPERVHVAITEGGSIDHTPTLLHHLARALAAVGGSYSIRSTGDRSTRAFDQETERVRI
jgi:hypothetical protein